MCFQVVIHAMIFKKQRNNLEDRGNSADTYTRPFRKRVVREKASQMRYFSRDMNVTKGKNTM